jgi:hypothetical protein
MRPADGGAATSRRQWPSALLQGGSGGATGDGWWCCQHGRRGYQRRHVWRMHVLPSACFRRRPPMLPSAPADAAAGGGRCSRQRRPLLPSAPPSAVADAAIRGGSCYHRRPSMLPGCYEPKRRESSPATTTVLGSAMRGGGAACFKDATSPSRPDVCGPWIQQWSEHDGGPVRRCHAVRPMALRGQ